LNGIRHPDESTRQASMSVDKSAIRVLAAGSA
jgi:hypothetical protein